jgi:hypothetical protein
MKHIMLSILMIAGVLLAACSSVPRATPAGSTGNSLPIETQLAVGTLQLAGTAQDVSGSQAEELVSYWLLYQDLSQSDTAATEEVEAVVATIQETMTAEQRQAIAEMEITQTDVDAAVQAAPIISRSSGTLTVSISTGSSGGGMPAGTLPGEAGAVPPDGGIPMDVVGASSVTKTSQTVQAASSLQQTSGAPAALVEAVIQSLQAKINTQMGRDRAPAPSQRSGMIHND